MNDPKQIKDIDLFGSQKTVRINFEDGKSVYMKAEYLAGLVNMCVELRDFIYETKIPE